MVDRESSEDVFSVDDSIRQLQVEKIKSLKEERDNEKVLSCLSKLESSARGDINLMPAILEAIENYATLGEVSDVMRKVFGEYSN